MPKTLIGRILMWAYIVGYWFRLAVIAVAAWPALEFVDWWSYMAWQAVYGIVWPVLVAVALL